MTVELSDHPAEDFCNQELVDLLIGWIRSGIVLGVWLATPCTTWSIAHTTPIVRTMKHLFGVPGLDPKHLRAVQAGNRTMLATVRVIESCIHMKVPVALENPQSSKLFKVPRLQKLFQHVSHHSFVTDQCQYGTPWRKTTLVASWFCGTDAPCKRCRCGNSGICTRSGKQHIHLSGRPFGSNKPWTAMAQSYPTLSRVL